MELSQKQACQFPIQQPSRMAKHISVCSDEHRSAKSNWPEKKINDLEKQ